MRIRIRSFWTQKAGNTAEEYEDAVGVPGGSETRLPLRVAVADGATETSFAGLWARLLVEGYGAGRIGSRRPLAGVAPLAAFWQAQVTARPLPWYAEEKVRQGAHAALLGLTIERRAGVLHWRALAIGDSCLLHLPDSGCLTAFPLSTSAAFTNRPFLLGSAPADAAGIRAHIRRRSGTVTPGDRFLLATDAVASTLLAAHEAGDSVSQTTSHLLAGGLDAFRAWVEGERTARRMRNDDATVVIVAVEHAGVEDGLADSPGV